MSYTTRCPACGTMFKVVPDQLKISDGWVRCGHCSDVFDATLYLDEWADGDAPSPAIGAARSGPEPQQPSWRAAQAVPQMQESPGAALMAGLPGTVQADASQMAQALVQPPWPFEKDQRGDRSSVLVPLQDQQITEPMPLPDRVSGALEMALSLSVRGGTSAATPRLSGPEPASPARAAAPADEEAPPARVRQGVTEDFRAELLQFAGSAAGSDAVTADPVDVPIGLPLHAEGLPAEAPPVPGGPAKSSAPVPLEEDEPEPVPGFVQQARRKAFWRRPLVRAMLSLLVLLLAGVLLAQWAHHDRHRLVAWQPQLEPALRLMCAPPDCEIGPLRRIDDIVIDSTALVRRLGNFYSFDIVLKNQADVALAAPALELTLTDTRDQTIARRVFLPVEWPEQPVAVPARGSVSVHLRLAIELGDGVPMAGYRALVFYP